MKEDGLWEAIKPYLSKNIERNKVTLIIEGSTVIELWINDKPVKE